MPSFRAGAARIVFDWVLDLRLAAVRCGNRFTNLHIPGIFGVLHCGNLKLQGVINNNY